MLKVNNKLQGSTNIHNSVCLQTPRWKISEMVVSGSGVIQYLVCAVENGIPFCRLNIRLDFILKIKYMNSNVCKCDYILQKVSFTTVPELQTSPLLVKVTAIIKFEFSLYEIFNVWRKIRCLFAWQNPLEKSFHMTETTNVLCCLGAVLGSC